MNPATNPPVEGYPSLDTVPVPQYRPGVPEQVAPSDVLKGALRRLVAECYHNSRAHGFWDGPENNSLPTKVALMHSELSELLEAYRKGNPPCEKAVDVVKDGAPVRVSSTEEEVADLFIRLCDFCGNYEIDLGAVTLAKMAYNATRSHMHGNRKC